MRAALLGAANLRRHMQLDVVPHLEVLAANQDELDRYLDHRFDRDEPPPYASSTESPVDPQYPIPSMPTPKGFSELPATLVDILNEPLTDQEIDDYVDTRPWSSPSIMGPADVYRLEAQVVNDCEDLYCNPVFSGLAGTRRRGVLVRHCLKRRWEKLGVWNPDWGFAGRHANANDEGRKWRWKWESQDDAADVEAARVQLVRRVLRQRQNLRRGESVPVIPHSHLEEGATAEQAESFITTRPWFMFQIEIEEERLRYGRLASEEGHDYDIFPGTAEKQVIERWKQRGDWRPEFDRIRYQCVPSWKWRHESASPEPEDLSQLQRPAPWKSPVDYIWPQNSGLDTVDFTPSEIDALETIEKFHEHPGEEPESFWRIHVRSGDLPPDFPGQTDEPIEMIERRRRRLLGLPSPTPPPQETEESRLFRERGSLFDGGWFNDRGWINDKEGPIGCGEEHYEASPQEPEEPPAGPSEDRPRSRRSQNQIPLSPPQSGLRRSARIATMKRKAEPEHSQAAPNKKIKTRTTSVADHAQPAPRETRHTRAKSALRRPQKAEALTETKTRQKGKRPTKENNAGMSSGVIEPPEKRNFISSRTRRGTKRKG